MSMQSESFLTPEEYLDGLWILRSAGTVTDVLEPPSVGCLLVLADIYEKVEF